LLTVWNNMKASILRKVETSVAANGPTGVEYHKPQIVAPFQRTKASHAQPNIPHQSRREDP